VGKLSFFGIALLLILAAGFWSVRHFLEQICAVRILRWRWVALLLFTPTTMSAQALTLGKGFVLGPAGDITFNPAVVISGKRSITGSYFGTQTYTSFLQTDSSIIHLSPNQSYKVTFSYRILTAPSPSFTAIIYSPTEAATGHFLPGTNVTGVSGDSGKATFVNALGAYNDYQVFWSIAGTGAIVIDDIEIVNNATGQTVATENGEGPTIKPGLLSFSVTDSQTFALGPIGQSTNVIRSAALKDLDGDGYPEAILTVTTYPDQLPQPPTIIGASRGISLETNTFFPSGAPTLRHSPLTQFVDINGDGIDDLLFAESGLDLPPWTGSVIGVGLSNGQGSFTNVSPLIPQELQTVKAYTLAAGDLYGDGRVQIILPDTYDGTHSALLHWNGSGFDVQKNWIPQTLWASPTKLSSQERLVVTDLDGDGKQDLLIGGQNWAPNISIVFGGSSGFTADSLLTLPDGQFGHTTFDTFSQPGVSIAQGANVEHLIVADFDNDGLPDIFSLQEQVINYKPGVITNKNCDNYADVFQNGGTCTEEGQVGLQVFLNKGGRNFIDYTSASAVSILGRRLYEAAIPVDINNDGFTDVVGIYFTKSYRGEPGFAWGTTIFLNDGTGAFQVVEGADILPVAVISSSASDQKWELGGFLPTVVRPGRTEGVIVESVSRNCTSSACPVTANALNVYKVVANSSIGTGPGFVDPAPLGAPGFNEFYYLRHYLDAAAAVQAGQYKSGLAHYLAVGAAEGYQPHAPNAVVAAHLAALPLSSTGTATATTAGTSPTVSAGYATATLKSGTTPFATAVFSLTQNGVVVSEAGVPASSPVENARLFIDYRTAVAAGSGTININTGIAIANANASPASLTFTLRDQNGQTIAVGRGTLPPNAHHAKFVNELQDIAPDFAVPASFPTAILFGSLEIDSSQPLSVMGLRLTVNQRGETLLTTTPVANLLKAPATSAFYFPQLVDGSGYTTSVVLSNTSGTAETGTISIMDANGNSLTVGQARGVNASSFAYSIPAAGVFVFQTDGSSAAVHVGWIKVAPDSGTPAPAGLGIFSFTAGGILTTQSGIPSVLPTLHARIYVDMSSGHDSGIALGNPGNSPIAVALQTFRSDGTATGNVSTINIAGNGHTAAFVDELVTGLPSGFTGLADFTSAVPFVPLTLRTLKNARGEFLLTTFPAPDVTTPAPSPIVFPRVADGGGLTTEFIFIPAKAAASVNVDFIPDAPAPLVGSGRP
jgi:hypothetical protein